MTAFTPSSIRLATQALGVALALAPSAFAGDVSVQLDESTGFVIEDSTGAIERLRVDESTGNLSRNGALFMHTPGPNDLFIGEGAGNPATAGTGGNTGVGYGVLLSDTSGSANSAFGDRALELNTTGSRNLALGQNAGQNQTTGSDNVYLANPGVAQESGRIRIGTDPAHTATFVAGIHGTNLGGSALPVFVSSNGQLGTAASQTQWTGDVDASDSDLTGLRRLALGPVLEASGGFNVDFPNTTGNGFTIASAEGMLSGGIGVARDTTATIGFNWNQGGVNHGTPFNPFFGLSFESGFPTATWPSDSAQEFHIIAGSGRTAGTVADATGFAADQPIMVEKPGNGAAAGIGIIKSIGAGPGATTVIDWMYSETASTNPPASGDTLEGESSTTVTNRSGTFSMTGGGLWVYPSSTCGTNGSTATAILGLSSISNQIGVVADLVWLRSSGLGTDVVPGNCVRQSLTGATALLGAISVAATTSFTSAPTATNDGSWRPMTTVFTPHEQAMASAWFSNRVVMEAAVPTLQIGSTTAAGLTNHWLGIASGVTGPGGNDYVGAIGSPAADENFGIWGSWWIFEPGTTDYVSLGATAITGTRTQNLADVSGTIAAFTDLTGCAEDAPVLASGPGGGLKCGTPSLSSARVVENQASGTDAAIASLLALRPARVARKADQTLPTRGEASLTSGLMAEQVAESSPDLVVYDEQGQPIAVRYPGVAAMLWDEMKKQQHTIDAQARAIEKLRQKHEDEIAALTTRLAAIETRATGGAGQAQR